jgi:hypothetical protein
MRGMRMSEGFDTAILILAFNRPDRLRGLLDRLRGIRPTRLYLAVDGPRAEVPSDVERVQQTRDLEAVIDWPCRVETLFQSGNLGCGRGVSTGIDWFFTHEAEGIILEDDVLPDPSFFPFCGELLERYRNDPRVFSISGSNFVPPEHISQKASYRFTHITHVWGWATWRDRWAHYEFDLTGWRKRLPIRQRWRATGSNVRDLVYWTAILDQVKSGRIDTWDYQLNAAQMAVGGMSANANVNLVQNTGFHDVATHTARPPDHLRPVEAMEFPLTHPTPVIDAIADDWYSAKVFRDTRLSLGAMARKHTVERLASLAKRT